MSLNIESLNASNAYGEYSISVRKVDELNSGNKQYTSLNYNDLYKSTLSEKRRLEILCFWPELRGEMISGKITNKRREFSR